LAGRSDDIFIPLGLGGANGDAVKDAVSAFVSADHTATRFYVTSTDDPYSTTAFSTVRAVRDELAAAAPAFGIGATGSLDGPTAQLSDVQAVLASDFQRVGIVTVIGILIVLVILLRAVVAPLYLVATVLLSYASAVGLAAWLFQGPLGHPGVSYPAAGVRAPHCLGSDYNIFTRAGREESEQRRSRQDPDRVRPYRGGHHLGRPDPCRHVRLDGDGPAHRPVPDRHRGGDRRADRHVPGPIDPRPGDHDTRR
jgi:uncharacterized membrane protein YdfJ with MMPL/SSD domain